MKRNPFLRGELVPSPAMARPKRLGDRLGGRLTGVAAVALMLGVSLLGAPAGAKLCDRVKDPTTTAEPHRDVAFSEQRFPDPTGAVLASLDLVDAIPASGLPPAHAAISCGPVIARDGDYFGATVNVAARLVGVAGPGEVVVTVPTAERAAGDGVRYEELDPVTLKGIPEPVPVRRAVRA